MFRDIDKIFCINLITSSDRKEAFSSRFPVLVNSSIFEWYTTERDANDTTRGCFNSHRNILELAKKRNYSKIIVFEDDANLLVPWEKFINVVNDIKYPEDWKIIQLGYLPITVSKIKNNPSLVQINSSLCMHSYIANVNKLEIPEYSGIPIDNLLLGTNFNNIIFNTSVRGVYGIYPNMLIRQNNFGSTITHSRDLLGVIEFDRDIWLNICTHIHYGMFIILFIMIIILVSNIIYFTKFYRR